MKPADLIRILGNEYGMPRLQPSDDPLAELILTVLSQNTSDANSGRAFIALLSRYHTWDDIMEAPIGDLIETIRSGGLAPQKAPRIQAILHLIKEAGWDWDLHPLTDLPLEEATAWLTALPGVGPKTAACVLLFGLGQPALPVDTHVERVGKRLGLVPPQISPERAQALLASLVDPDLYYPFHMLLIKHGRRTCRARTPHCSNCPLTRVCPSSSPLSGE